MVRPRRQQCPACGKRALEVLTVMRWSGRTPEGKRTGGTYLLQVPGVRTDLRRRAKSRALGAARREAVTAGQVCDTRPAVPRTQKAPPGGSPPPVGPTVLKVWWESVP